MESSSMILLFYLVHLSIMLTTDIRPVCHPCVLTVTLRIVASSSTNPNSFIDVVSLLKGQYILDVKLNIQTILFFFSH